MTNFQFKTELETLATESVFFANGGYEMNYKKGENQTAAKDLARIKEAGFNPTMTGRKYKRIFVPQTIVRKNGLRIIEVSK